MQWGILEIGGEIWAGVLSGGWSSVGGQSCDQDGASRVTGREGQVRQRRMKEDKPHYCTHISASCCVPQPAKKTKNSKNNSKHLLRPFYVPGIVINFSH